MRPLIIFLSFFSFLSAEHLFVEVETDDSLLPIVLVESKKGDEYVKAIEKVFAFDLSHNGRTALVPESKKTALMMEVRPVIDGHNLTVHFTSPMDQLERSFGSIPLSGYIAQDRREVHRVSDEIYRTLFGGRGIASSKILYTVRENGNSEVFECDYDGWNSRQVTKNAGYCLAPTYLPPKPGKSAGSYFYISYLKGPPKIYVSSLKEERGTPFLTLRGNQLMPAVSRTRDALSFVSDVGGNPDLFLQPFSPESGPTGRPRQIFAKGLSVQGTPSFSPDGTRLAFVSNQEGSPQIYVMQIPPKGTSVKEMNIKRLTLYGRENTCPSWSPDGTKIAYSGKSGGVRQIFVYDSLKNEHLQITSGPKNKENPTWAQNSLCLVYNSSDPGDSELYLVSLKEKKPIKITSGRGEKRFPAWEPL